MKRILVIDDNLMMRKLIMSLFSGNEYELSEASNGLEGIGLVQKSKYDLVITDILMPGMEGIELISRLKKEHPAIKIIAISGGKPYYLHLAKKMGTDGVFTKPLNRNSFVNHVSKVMQDN